MHAGMMDVQGIRPMALRWCSNRQQYTDREQFVRISGNLVAEFGGDRVMVRPADLYGNFDYIPKTGNQPPDPGQMAQVLMEGLGAILKQPAFLGMPDKEGNYLDPHEILKEILRDKGVKNVADFYRKAQEMAQQQAGAPGMPGPAPQVQVLPDDQVEQMQQAGNIVPMQGGMAA